ncbi:7655_t:CDS:2, partial [Acaulospora morrowiae]
MLERFSTCSCGHLTTNDVGSEGKTMRSSDGGFLDTIIDAGSVKGRSCGHLTVVFLTQLSSRDFPHVRARFSTRSCGHLTTNDKFSTRSCGHLTTNDVGSEGKTMRSSDGGFLDTIIDAGS